MSVLLVKIDFYGKGIYLQVLKGPEVTDEQLKIVLTSILFIGDYSEIKPALNLLMKDRDHLSRVHEHHAACARTPLWNIHKDGDSVAPNKRYSQHLVLREAASP